MPFVSFDLSGEARRVPTAQRSRFDRLDLRVCYRRSSNGGSSQNQGNHGLDDGLGGAGGSRQRRLEPSLSSYPFRRSSTADVPGALDHPGSAQQGFWASSSSELDSRLPSIPEGYGSACIETQRDGKKPAKAMPSSSSVDPGGSAEPDREASPKRKPRFPRKPKAKASAEA